LELELRVGEVLIAEVAVSALLMPPGLMQLATDRGDLLASTGKGVRTYLPGPLVLTIERASGLNVIPS
jgi:hypothetical protein